MILGFKTQNNGKPTGFVGKIQAGTKIHTLREDPNGRWRAGMPIEFSTGVRTKDYQQFGKAECTGVQRVVINHWEEDPFSGTSVFVDDEVLSEEQASEFAHNDGFDTWADFCEWFKYGFDGKLIHWTLKRY